MFTLRHTTSKFLGGGKFYWKAAAALWSIMLATGLTPADVALAQSIEEARLWRAELRITVCNDSKAGTDAQITASLGGEPLILNRGEDDFKRGRTYAYDLRPPSTVGDIREIRLLVLRQPVQGSPDALCIDTIELSVNHPGAALRRDFTIFSTRVQRWLRLKESPELVMGGPTLRASALWNLAGPRAGIANLRILFASHPIERASIEQIIETIVGDAIARDRRVGWGRRFGERHVALRTTKTPNTAKIDLDLGRRGSDLRVMAIDVDFNLMVTCNPREGNLDVSMTNFDARASLPLPPLPGGSWDNRLRDQLRAFGQGLGRSVNLRSGEVCRSLNLRFDDGGNLRLF